MPILHVTTNITLDDSAKAEAVAAFSALCADVTKKPEAAVLAILEDGQAVTFGGSAEPAAYAVFQSVGLPQLECPTYSKALAKAFKKHLGVESDRAYIVFEDLERPKVGFKGRTLAS